MWVNTSWQKLTASLEDQDRRAPAHGGESPPPSLVPEPQEDSSSIGLWPDGSWDQEPLTAWQCLGSPQPPLHQDRHTGLLTGSHTRPRPPDHSELPNALVC